MKALRSAAAWAPHAMLLAAVALLLASLPTLSGVGSAPIHSGAVTASGIGVSLAFLLACIAFNHGASWVRWTAGATWLLALVAGLHWIAWLAGG